MRLTGITWNHTRGYLPLVATAQRYEELHPGVGISWERRSLQAFADAPVDQLAERYDLIVLDHPWAGSLGRNGQIVPLDEHLPAAFLDDQRRHSVGRSHESYSAGGHQWALAIDAATPVASWRPDVMGTAGATVPETWDDLLALARRGLVALPAIPLDSLMHLYMLWIGLGETPFTSPDHAVPADTGVEALEVLRELVSLCDPRCLTRNPIQTFEAMTTTDDIGYCPFAYGYVPYARRDFTARPLRFGSLVGFPGCPLRSTLGGTGLAISRRCADIPLALDYARYVAGAECQTHLYVAVGGQPGYRSAWMDTDVNARCGSFFAATLKTVDDAFLRPTYNGYIGFQDRAGPVIHGYLHDGGDPRPVVEAVDRLYRESREQGD